MALLCLRLLSAAREEESGWSLASEWLMQNEDGTLRGRGVTDYRGLADLLDPGQTWVKDARNVLLLVPHDQVLELTVKVPGKSAAQMRRALPFAVEEFASADIESLHIASDQIRPGRPVRCQLVDRSLLEGWLACLRTLGIEPGYLLVDTELLPFDVKATHVLMDGPIALIRSPDEAAMVDRGNLLMALQMIAPPTVYLAGGQLDPLEAAQLPDTEIIAVESGGSSIEYLVRHWRRDEHINLLQGRYAPVHTSSNRTYYWRPVALVASLWIAIAWVLMIGESFWASWQGNALDTEARALYASIYPADSNVRNIRRSLAEKLGQDTEPGGPGFTHLTASLASALVGGAQVRSLEFDQESAELKAEVLVGSHEEAEGLKVALSKLGIQSQLLNATQEDQQIRAYFSLRSAS
jgi:general secretion pathway protein L